MRVSIGPNQRGRVAGIALFLFVTAAWAIGWAASFELGWIGYDDSVAVLAAGASAVTLVVTGYLARYRDALWLGWIPGATMVAIGFAMTPEVGGDETGGSMIFFGFLVLLPGWPLYFFPLMALGTWLRGRLGRRSPTTSPALLA
jgi:hypothetical protein